LERLRVRSIGNKALKRLIEDNDDREIRRDLVPRVRRILTALVSATNMKGVEGPPGWRIHQLTGDRAGTWSISVSGNWRITFKIEGDAIKDLDLEDYH
jgi:proteic killer suppression protein